MTPAIPSPYMETIPDDGSLIRVTVLRDTTADEAIAKYGFQAAGDIEAFQLRMGESFVGVVQQADDHGFLLAFGDRLQAFELFDPIAIALLAPAALALAA